jgi:hypothetical protein
MIFSKSHINEVEVITCENGHIKFEIAPAVGGKIISIFNKKLGKEFLWRNESLLLETLETGADYDSNFYGGIDELLPNDIPENIDGVDYPDHGELWTTRLDYELNEDSIAVFGKLKLSGLYYKKTIHFNANKPMIHLEYKIKNESGGQRNFLWKLHAALVIEEGDQLITTAKKGKVVDPDYSRFNNLNEFDWPVIENTNASAVPAKNNSVDFFYLYNIEQAEMKFLTDKDKYLFSYQYDKKIFPYQWYFASYGGFLDHYTAIIEPCSSMPMSINDAKNLNQCSILAPNEEINTVVNIYAGENNL